MLYNFKKLELREKKKKDGLEMASRNYIASRSAERLVEFPYTQLKGNDCSVGS
jgi:hypothetical protein